MASRSGWLLLWSLFRWPSSDSFESGVVLSRDFPSLDFKRKSIPGMRRPYDLIKVAHDAIRSRNERKATWDRHCGKTAAKRKLPRACLSFRPSSKAFFVIATKAGGARFILFKLFNARRRQTFYDRAINYGPPCPPPHGRFEHCQQLGWVQNTGWSEMQTGWHFSNSMGLLSAHENHFPLHNYPLPRLTCEYFYW